jgi:hypothetical protein
LQAAHNSAVWLASEAQLIRTTLSCVYGRRILIGPKDSELIAQVVDNVRREHNGCKAAIDAVVQEMARTRKHRLRLGDIVAASAHEAAIDLSRKVVDAVWHGCAFVKGKDKKAEACRKKAFDVLQRICTDHTARFDSAWIIGNYEGIVKYFAQQKAAWPNASDIIAEVKIESSKAADRRRRRAARADESAILTDSTKAAQRRQSKIPPAKRTRPMSLREAARLMGYENSRDAAEKLRAAIKTGALKYEKLTRQQHVFSIDDFPSNIHKQILPK